MSYYKISTNDKLYFRGTIHVVKAVNDDTIEFFNPCPHCLMHQTCICPRVPLTDDQQAMLDMAVEAGAYSESLFPVELWGRPVKPEPAESHWRCSQCHEVVYNSITVRDSTSQGLIRVSGKCRRCGSNKLEFVKSDRKLSHQEKMCCEIARVWNNAKAARIKEMKEMTDYKRQITDKPDWVPCSECGELVWRGNMELVSRHKLTCKSHPDYVKPGRVAELRKKYPNKYVIDAKLDCDVTVNGTDYVDQDKLVQSHRDCNELLDMLEANQTVDASIGWEMVKLDKRVDRLKVALEAKDEENEQLGIDNITFHKAWEAERTWRMSLQERLIKTRIALEKNEPVRLKKRDECDKLTFHQERDRDTIDYLKGALSELRRAQREKRD